MLYKEYIKINALSVHRIGKKSAVEGVELSKTTVVLNEKLRDILKAYFLMAFKDEERYVFTHPTRLDLNSVYTYVSAIFDNVDSFHEESINIANFLYEQSEHPNIKRGDFYVIHFKDCILDGETIDAIGLFKSENKDTFIQINPVAGGFRVESLTGMNINRLDKGCLIFNTNRDNGYVVCVVDNANRNDAKYWVNDFLQLKRCEDDYRKTEQIVAMCKGFISHLSNEYDKATKAIMINKVLETLEEERVSINSFAVKAFNPIGVGDAFKNYANDFQTKQEISLNDSFQVKAESINRRGIKAVTKVHLDKNFEISILGGEENIEKGYNQERGQKYYTFFYDREK